jgi:hypothetical protein
MKILIAIAAVALVLIAGFFFMGRNIGSDEPYITKIYCLRSSSQDAEDLLQAISQIASGSDLEVNDRSADVAKELASLNEGQSGEVLHGVLIRNGALVATYSNLGSNDRVFHMSFYVEDYEGLSKEFDSAIKGVVSVLREKTISGGAFDDSFCEA